MYETSFWAVAIFTTFVVLVLWISYYFARRTKTAEGYFAAGGQIHWSVNGIAFAGDYLSAASFLGICGMIATAGYDGFLYSIGYLAGWIVALFVVAEPIKRLGKYTFTDAIDSQFDSKSIRLVAAISTLVVSVFYLIPQMVGAGALVTPLLGLDHWVGVVMVGAIVTVIVATAGMASTTYVQFLKGGLLIIFSIALVIVTLYAGLKKAPAMPEISAVVTAEGKVQIDSKDYQLVSQETIGQGAALIFAELSSEGKLNSWWHIQKKDENQTILRPCQWVVMLATPVTDSSGKPAAKLYNGIPITESKPLTSGGHGENTSTVATLVVDGQETDKHVEGLSIPQFLEAVRDSTHIRYANAAFSRGADKITIYYPKITAGKDIMRPGLKFKVDTKMGATAQTKTDFASLMLALVCGTAALPHILIRYYTVPTASSARKSTIVAIGTIGLFYLLTLFMGLGAMVNGVVDLTNDNMSAPLLAKRFGITLFAIISAIAFATVLGTVSGLIVAASGAIAHDVMDKLLKLKMSDKGKVFAGKITAIAVGIIAIFLGVVYEGMNVSYLVGWAFAVAASANMPAIIMILFWKKTTKYGIASSIAVGMISAVGLILLSPNMYVRYGLPASQAPFGLNEPAIVSIPLSVITLVVVSLMTQKHWKNNKTALEK